MAGKKKAITILVISITVALILSWVLVMSIEHEEGPIKIEIGSSFIVLKDGPNTVAINESSGAVVLTSTHSSAVIQACLDSLVRGGTVLVREGDYRLVSELRLGNNVHLLGEGAGTVFHTEGAGGFYVEGRYNVTLESFTIKGQRGILVASYGVPTHDIKIMDIVATLDASHEGSFYLLSAGGMVANVSFLRCTALEGGTSGFVNNGRMAGDGWLRNISYRQCKAIGCGLGDRYNDWVVGFDLAERVNVDNIQLLDCEASGNWQSGFHFEPNIMARNVTLQDCTAVDNGRAQGAPGGEGYGWGYVIYTGQPNHDLFINNCSAAGNWLGDTNLGTLEQVQGLGDQNSMSVISHMT